MSYDIDRGEGEGGVGRWCCHVFRVVDGFFRVVVVLLVDAFLIVLCVVGLVYCFF